MIMIIAIDRMRTMQLLLLLLLLRSKYVSRTKKQPTKYNSVYISKGAVRVTIASRQIEPRFHESSRISSRVVDLFNQSLVLSQKSIRHCNA